MSDECFSLMQYGCHEFLPRVTPPTGTLQRHLQLPHFRRISFYNQKLFRFRRCVAGNLHRTFGTTWNRARIPWCAYNSLSHTHFAAIITHISYISKFSRFMLIHSYLLLHKRWICENRNYETELGVLMAIVDLLWII